MEDLAIEEHSGKTFSEQTRENNEITMINFQSVPKVIWIKKIANQIQAV